MEQWEYAVKYLAHRGGDKRTPFTPGTETRCLWELDLEKALNKLGADGWEVVSFPGYLLRGSVDGYALLKRKKIKE